MKVKAIVYKHSPEVSLFLLPETDVERVLLQSMWNHGRLEIVNGVADASSQGFAITTQPNEAARGN